MKQMVPNYKKSLQVLLLVILGASSITSYAQTVYGENGDGYTNYIPCGDNNNTIIVNREGFDNSDGACGDGTHTFVKLIVVETELSAGIYPFLNDVVGSFTEISNNFREPLNLQLVWNPAFAGKVRIEFKQGRKTHNATGCHSDNNADDTQHTSYFIKEGPLSFVYVFNPSLNSLTNTIEVKKGQPLTAQHVANGLDPSHTSYSTISYTLNNTEVAKYNGNPFQATGTTNIPASAFTELGYQTFNMIAQNASCGNNKQEAKIVVLPTCTDAVITATIKNKDGSALTPVNGGFQLLKGQKYTILFDGDPEFGDNYKISSTSPANIKVLSQNGNQAIIQVLADIGSFRLEATPITKNVSVPSLQATRNLYEHCPAPFVKVFVGGKDFELNANCLITIPQYFITAQPPIFLLQDTDKGKDLIFSNFQARVTSSVGIKVEVAADEEFKLTDGAELVISAPVIDNYKAEPGINWEHTVIYDEEGSPISEGRSYEDGFGQNIQNQVKNYSKHAVIGNHTLLDDFGRPVLSSLPAPIRGNSVQTSAVKNCGSDVLAGQDLYFEYKPNFIATNNGNPYSWANLGKPIPDPVSSTEVGSLGYYYSSNNVLNPETNLREPLTAQSKFPYSRLSYNEWGDVGEVSSPGDYTTLGSGHTNTVQTQTISKSSDAYLQKYFALRGTLFDQNPEENYIEVKTTDAQGQQTRSVSNAEGQALLTEHLATHHQTWFFYNDRGQTVLILPPNGVLSFLAGKPLSTIERKTYSYDSKGLVISSTDPDRGIVSYIYRKDGALRFSQDSRQKAQGRFSYVNYDFNDRVIEKGEFTPTDVTWSSNFSYTNRGILTVLEKDASNESLTTGGTKTDVTLIGYDQPSGDAPFLAQFTMGKVAWTEKPGISKTYYNYDERGRLIQGVKDLTATGLDAKTTNYLYGSASGNISVVAYQDGKADAFYHYYQYDAHGRLNQVYTSLTPVHNSKGAWSNSDASLVKQANYDFYLTGGVKRTELGDKLQGLDYTYTIQGDLKAINSPYYKNNVQYDPGQDGLTGSQNAGVAKDIFGMAFDYYTGDFTPVDNTLAASFASATTISGTDRFDGSIRNTAFANFHLNNTLNVEQYTYDNKGQLASATGKTATFIGAAWNFTDKGLNESPTYDPQGNFLTKTRVNSNNSSQSSVLNYAYIANSNRLLSVSSSNVKVYDFVYDEAGRMAQRIKSGSTQKFAYDASDMVVQIKDGSDKIRVEYVYDEYGQKIRKKAFNVSGLLVKTEFYSYDANGTLMSIYSQNLNENLRRSEVPLYGMERLGILYFTKNNSTEVPTYTYEIKDQVGSVRATVTKNTNGTANVLSYGEYFAFGAEIADRSTISSFGKRFGYQGEWAEKDRDNTDLTEFDLRQYDADLGRWMMPDPYNQYHSPYLAMGNDPVNSIDPDGGFSSSSLVRAGIYVVGGAVVGGVIGAATAGDGDMMESAGKGALIGAGAGLLAFGIGSIDLGTLNPGAIFWPAKGLTETIKIIIKDDRWNPKNGDFGPFDGHTMIQIDKKTYGLSGTPTRNGKGISGNVSVKKLWHSDGEIKVKTNKELDSYLSGKNYRIYKMKVTPGQKSRLSKNINTSKLNPPDYRFLGKRCTSWASKMLRMSRIIGPLSQLNEHFPSQFENYIKKRKNVELEKEVNGN